MSATGFKLQYQDANNATQTVVLEGLGASEGGKAILNTGLPRFSFKSHGASECTVRLPAVSPDIAAKIPFESEISILYKNNPIFQGRRINRPGSASPTAPYVEYCFQDAWYDFEHITFKQAWFGGAYQAASLAGNVVTFTNAQLGQSAEATQMILYAANGATAAIPGTVVNITSWTDTTHAVISGSFSGTVAFATMLYTYPDVVLFQYRPTHPYQNASQVSQFYITTGAQIQEILDFAIAQGVNIQYVQAELLANCNIYAPWYPLRAGKCAEALKKCLAWHPDCFTEIDYTTTTPTFHVRKRGAASYGLVPVTLPYKSTDSAGNQHEATDINPRPELVPSRIGISYRYLVNGVVLAFPKDFYPANVPDGLRAFDYSLDLQGPRVSSQLASIKSVSFDPTNIEWWVKKCHALSDSGITALAMVDSTGKVPGTSALNVLDDNGNQLDFINGYAWELVSGSVEFWFGPSAVMANVSTYFAYKGTGSNGELLDQTKSHFQTVRVKLVNSPSIVESFTQFLTTGEAIPSGLAQSVYTALQPLQYTLSHKLLATPFSGAFVKPGLNALNISGGSSDWLTMAATPQQTDYTLHCDANGNCFAEYSVRCGPVEHLEPGQLVQLFNLFANRDMVKIDPWERITGLSSPNGGVQTGGETAAENAHPGIPKKLLTTHISITPDANGFYTVHQVDARSSGIALFKWDGTSKTADGVPAPNTTQPSLLLDLSQIDMDPSDPLKAHRPNWFANFRGPKMLLEKSSMSWRQACLLVAARAWQSQIGARTPLTRKASSFTCKNPMPLWPPEKLTPTRAW